MRLDRRSIFASLLATLGGLFGKNTLVAPNPSRPALLIMRDGWPLMLVRYTYTKHINQHIEVVFETPPRYAVVAYGPHLCEVQIEHRSDNDGKPFSVGRFTRTDEHLNGHPIYRETWRSKC